MNDTMQVENNSEYELIRKPEPRHLKARVNRLAIRLGLGIFYLMYLLFMLTATIVAMIAVESVGGNPNIVLNFLLIVMVGYALWRSRLLTNWVERIVWTLIILTGIGAWVFLLLDLVANLDRNIVKQKRIMG